VVETSSQIEALDAERTGTRVVFEWCEDRFRHSIYVVLMGEPILLVESVEGDSIEAWPPSPPLQQLHQQPSPTGREMLLLTGMAGKSYWSGSVTTAVDVRCTLMGFDFACRHRLTPDWLGVTYQIADGVHVKQAQPRGAVVFQVGDSLQCTLYPAAIGMSLATENVLTSSVELVGNTIRIAATETPHVTTATTKQWAYEIQLSRPYWMTKSPPIGV
jgi:hypothetical protein